MRRRGLCHALKARKNFRSGCYYVCSQISSKETHAIFLCIADSTGVLGFIYILAVGLNPDLGHAQPVKIQQQGSFFC